MIRDEQSSLNAYIGIDIRGLVRWDNVNRRRQHTWDFL